MSFSTDPYTGDGNQTDYAVTFPYILKEHVFVEIDDVATTAYTWFNNQMIRFDTAPAAGASILIYRNSSPDLRLVDYIGEQAFDEATLDTDSLQAFYLIQEILDAVLRSVRVGDTELSLLPNVEIRAGKFLVFGSDGDIGVSTFSLEDVITQAGAINSVVVIQESAPTSPATGLLWYQPSTGELFIWDGDSWESICCGNESANGNYNYYGTSGELTNQADIAVALPGTGDQITIESYGHCLTGGTDLHMEFSFDGGSSWAPANVWNIDSEINSNGDETTNVLYIDNSIELSHFTYANSLSYVYSTVTLSLGTGEYTTFSGWVTDPGGGAAIDICGQRLVDGWLETATRPTHVRLRATSGNVSGKVSVYFRPDDAFTNVSNVAGYIRPLVAQSVVTDTALAVGVTDPLTSHAWQADIRLKAPSGDAIALLEFQTVAGWSSAGTDIDFTLDRSDLFNINTPTHSASGGYSGVGVGSIYLTDEAATKEFSSEADSIGNWHVEIFNPGSTGEKWGFIRGVYMASNNAGAQTHEAQAVYISFRFKEANPILGIRVRLDGGETFTGKLQVSSVAPNNNAGQSQSISTGSGTGVTSFNIDMSSVAGSDVWRGDVWVELDNVPYNVQPTLTVNGGSAYKYKTQKLPAPHTDRYSAPSGGTSGDNAAFYQAPVAMDTEAGSKVILHIKQLAPSASGQMALASQVMLFDTSEGICTYMHNCSIVTSVTTWRNTLTIGLTGAGTFDYRYMAGVLVQDEVLLADSGDLVVLKDSVVKVPATKRWNFTGSLVSVTQDGGDPTQANIEILPTPAPSLALDDLTDVNLTGAADGNVLTRVGGVWVPQAPAVGGGTDSSGVWEVVSTHTISPGATEIDIVETALAWSNYDEIRLLIQDYYGSGSNTALYGRVSTDGGSTFVSTVSYEDVVVANYNTTVERFKFNRDRFEVGGAVGNSVDKSLNAQVVMSGHAGASRTHFRVDVAQTNTFLTLVRGIGASVFTPTTVVNALRLYPSSGTMQGGKVVVLGLNSAATTKNLGDLGNVDTTGQGNHDVLTYRSGSGTWEPGRRNNVTTTDPGATHDSAAGYEEGSMWVNTTDNGVFVCVDATVSAAVWAEIASVANSSGWRGVSTTVVSAQAQQDISLSGVTAGVRRIRVSLDGITVNNDDQRLLFRVGTGGTIDSGTVYHNRVIGKSSGAAVIDAVATNWDAWVPLSSDATEKIGNAAGESYSATFVITDFNTTTLKAKVEGRVTYVSAAGDLYHVDFAGMYATTGAAVNILRFIAPDGATPTFSGTITLEEYIDP